MATPARWFKPLPPGPVAVAPVAMDPLPPGPVAVAPVAVAPVAMEVAVAVAPVAVAPVAMQVAVAPRRPPGLPRPIPIPDDSEDCDTSLVHQHLGRSSGRVSTLLSTCHLPVAERAVGRAPTESTWSRCAWVDGMWWRVRAGGLRVGEFKGCHIAERLGDPPRQTHGGHQGRQAPQHLLHVAACRRRRPPCLDA